MHFEAKPTSAVRIRNAILDDASKISALLEEAPVGAGWSSAQIRELVAAVGPRAGLRRVLLVLEEAGEPLGFLSGKIVAPESELENIVIDPRARRRGLADALLREFLRQAEQQAGRVAFLEVRESNAAARALYEKNGFRETGRRKRYYRNPEEDAILYCRSLGAMPAE